MLIGNPIKKYKKMSTEKLLRRRRSERGCVVFGFGMLVFGMIGIYMMLRSAMMQLVSWPGIALDESSDAKLYQLSRDNLLGMGSLSFWGLAFLVFCLLFIFFSYQRVIVLNWVLSERDINDLYKDKPAGQLEE